ncbi:MAG: hypothetical protein U1E10_17110 [Bdellovibrionales bacterium]|nr:hypothetical protein [Bdellovibrionales bacterium]
MKNHAKNHLKDYAKKQPIIIFLVLLALSTVANANTFVESCYLARYPDVVTGWVNNGGKAIDHWNRHGQFEGRIPDCRGMAMPNPPPPTPPGAPPPSVNPPSGSQYTINGGGPRPIEISVDPVRFAGAVSSVKWNGVEFINVHDRGRQLQTAVQYDGYAECNNPTEAGSSHDGRGARSTSRLLAHSKTSPSQLANQIQMAYWSYRQLTGACVKGIDTRLTSPLSNTVLNKNISIGAFGDPQIVDYSLTITHQKRDVALEVTYELLTGYLNSEFKRFFYVSKKTGGLAEYLASDLKDISGNGFPPGSYMGQAARKQQFDPVIMSNASGSHAMGAYIPASQIANCKSGFGYAVFHFNLGGSGPNGAGTNKWNLAAYDSVNSKCIVNNSRSFKVYLVVGTLAEVHQKLGKLLKSAP